MWNYVYPQLGGIGVSSLMVSAKEPIKRFNTGCTLQHASTELHLKPFNQVGKMSSGEFDLAEVKMEKFLVYCDAFSTTTSEIYINILQVI